MSVTDSLLAPLYSGGIAIGVVCGGFFFIPSNQGGLIMQDANGVNWLLTVGTDGRLSTQQITF